MHLWRPYRCNCRIWALVMLLRFGGGLAKRPSFAGWWKHVFWSPDGETLYEYAPLEYDFERRIPPILFRGHVREVVSEFIEQTVVIGDKKIVNKIDLTPRLKRQL